jgi:hypothetical protein
MLWLGLFLVGVLAVNEGGRAVVGAMQPRGIRNNNPGNIRRTGEQWLGLAPEQTDPEFYQFADPLFGIRAMAKVLRTYQSRHGLRTLEEWLTRWAPPDENPTADYIAAVERETGIPRDRAVEAGELPEVIAAMIRFENGTQPYPAALIVQGVQAA